MRNNGVVRGLLDKLSDLGIGRYLVEHQQNTAISSLITRISKPILRRSVMKFGQGSHRRAQVLFSNPPRSFQELVAKYGSDKDSGAGKAKHPWSTHTYGDIYELLFSHCRTKFLNVFECGIGSINSAVTSNMGSGGVPGGSLRIWRDYFPNAQIYGADIDPETLFQDERIATFLLDQTSEASIQALWNSLPGVLFDLIIDDGLHTPEAGLTLLKNSLNMLGEEGIYLIEDVSFRHLSAYKTGLQDLQVTYSLFACNREYENSLDNNIIYIRKV